MIFLFWKNPTKYALIDKCCFFFLHFCEDIGVHITPQKTEVPNQVLTFAGIKLDF